MSEKYDSPLRLWRKKKNFDLHQAAPLFGIKDAQLSRIERGASPPSAAVEERIIAVTELTRDQIAEPRMRAKRMKSPEPDKEREPALEAAQ
jgi:transcriptional regulator with XRE-family HTH domain